MSKTDDLIAELRVLVEEATDDLWTTDGHSIVVAWSDQANQSYAVAKCDGPDQEKNAPYIAACNPENMRALLSRITELEQSQRWISVDERLPDSDNCYVLVLCEGGNVDKTFFSLNRDFHRRAGNSYSRKDQGKLSGYFELSHKYGYKITHWLPLPGGI